MSNVFSAITITITWSPRTTDHFNKLNSATHVHVMVRRIVWVTASFESGIILHRREAFYDLADAIAIGKSASQYMPRRQQRADHSLPAGQSRSLAKTAMRKVPNQRPIRSQFRSLQLTTGPEAAIAFERQSVQAGSMDSMVQSTR